MTDSTDATEGLRRSVERVRKHKFGSLDAPLVNEILDVQFRFADERAEAEKQTDQLISRYVAKLLDADTRENDA